MEVPIIIIHRVKTCSYCQFVKLSEIYHQTYRICDCITHRWPRLLPKVHRPRRTVLNRFTDRLVNFLLLIRPDSQWLPSVDEYAHGIANFVFRQISDNLSLLKETGFSTTVRKLSMFRKTFMKVRRRRRNDFTNDKIAFYVPVIRSTFACLNTYIFIYLEIEKSSEHS